MTPMTPSGSLPEDIARRNRELEALNAVAATIGRGADLVTTAEETLGAVCLLTRTGAGAVYRIDRDPGSLVMVAHRGLAPEEISLLRERPLAGSYIAEVARSGRPAVNRMGERSPRDPRLRELAKRHRRRMQIAIPIPVKGEIWGVIALLSDEERELDPDELGLLESVARQVGVAVERASLLETAAARLRRLEALREIEGHISAQLDVGELLALIACSSLELIGGRRAVLYLSEGDTLVPKAWHPAGAAFDEARIPVGAGVSGTAAAGRRGIVENDYAGSGRALPALAAVLARVMAQPLLLGEAVVGVLTISREAGMAAFSDEDLATLGDFARQAAVAIRNARLLAEAQQRAAEYRALFEVGTLIGSTLHVERVLDLIAERARALMGVRAAGIFRLDESQGRLVYERGVGLSPEFVRAVRIRPGEGTTGRAFAQGAPAWSSDMLGDLGISLDETTRALVAREGYRATLSVPIVIKGRAYGVLAAYWWEAHEPTAVEIEVLGALAGQAAIALDNARLFEAAEVRAARLRVLARLGHIVSSSLDTDEVLGAIARAAAELMSAPAVLLWVADEGARTLTPRAFSDPRLAADFPVLRASFDDGAVGWVATRKERLEVPDVFADERFIGREWWRAHGLKSYLGVPITVEGTLFGVLGLSGAEPFDLGPDEQGLLDSFVAQAAAAIRNARLFEERTGAYEELAAAQDQLVRAEKLRALGEMASGVAHDFNNVLAVIVGRAQLLLAEVQEARHRRWLQVIERSGLDGAKTVRRLQEFSRVRRDQPFVAVSLNRVVEESLDATSMRWQEEARSRGVAVEVKTRLAADLPLVAGDAAELREVLTNLILNAVDAMPQGGTLTLATRRADGRVELLVSDTGVGMPDHVRERIFDPFFTTKGPQGTGLGLAMAYGILTRHGARVTVESAVGRGTSFRLSFAASDLPGEPRTDAAPPRPAGSLRCLVVDDEPEVAEVLGDVLASAGHMAVVVGGGAQAIERFQAERFDVVFTDLAMPGLSGWEVARRIKGLAPGVPVFLVTGFGVEVSAAEMKASGVEAVLPKPLRIQDILANLAQVKENRP
ncbi:MAG: hypothetical protein A2X52_11090 [Candidatus Rokubacteria bacterium GWC2_70_16]|nr:MAG: hypothetical protein A2X52_11090 [Candidatus Rokubacteria bacterium GWC2_70_16]